MYHIKNDQRSIRSSEMLYEGLATLMRDKNYSDITVTDLVDASNVGRTTFYRNFDDIEDILHMRNDQVFEGLINYIVEYRQKESLEYRSAILKPVLRYFYLHSDSIELLIRADRIDIFQQAFRKLIETYRLRFRTFYDIEEDYVEYMIAFNTGAISSVLTHWIETGKRQAPDELADKLHMMYSSEKSPWASI